MAHPHPLQLLLLVVHATAAAPAAEVQTLGCKTLQVA
jgi:hypothetical protein